MKDLHSENYKTMLREIKEGTNKNVLFHTTQSSQHIQCNLYLYPTDIFAEIEKPP